MTGRKNFDQELRMRQSRATYLANKSKAGMAGSSAGKPRPYAKKNMAYARLHSPQLVGQTLTVSPKHQFQTFQVGKYYEWSIIEAGVGLVDGYELTAKEIKDHFMVIPKRKLL